MDRAKKENFLLEVAYIAVILGLIYISVRYLFFYLLPFLLGYGVAFLLKPLTNWMCKYMHMRRRPAAIFAAVIFYVTVAVVLWFLGTLAVSQIGIFVSQFPDMYDSVLLPAVTKINDWVVSLFSRLSADMGTSLSASLQSFSTWAMDAATGLSTSAVAGITGIAGKIPLYLIALVFTVISSIYICADYRLVVDFFFRQIPKKNHAMLLGVKDFAVGTVGRMVKAYVLIMGLTFLELAGGLLILGVPYFIPAAALIAFLDLLPVIGSGTILVPWAVVSLIQGQNAFGAGLLCLFAIISIVRNIIEPKIVGEQIGLHPLVTITSMFFAIQLLGFAGIFVGPLAALLVKYLNETGVIHVYKTA